jgi:hypothetical protein
MRKILTTAAAALTIAITVAPALRAQTSQTPQGSTPQPNMMGQGGMMQGGNMMPMMGMMQQMSQMMESCNKMMQTMTERQAPQARGQQPAPQAAPGNPG